MRRSSHPIMLSLLISFTPLSADAALQSVSIDGIDLVRSSISNITWTKDANLLDSLQTTLGHINVVNAIIDASPTVDYDFIVNDITGGVHTLSTADFFTGGGVTWYGAKAFTNYLSSIRYAGLSDWTLPSMEQFGQLIQGELNDFSRRNVPDTSSFDREQSIYWSSTTGGPNYSWQYAPSRLHFPYNSQLSVWAVSPSPINVGEVPVPATAWLFASGILGFVALKRRSMPG